MLCELLPRTKERKNGTEHFAQRPTIGLNLNPLFSQGIYKKQVRHNTTSASPLNLNGKTLRERICCIALVYVWMYVNLSCWQFDWNDATMWQGRVVVGECYG